MALDFTKDPFDKHRDLISNPKSYSESRTLGTASRDVSDLLVFYSARSKNKEKNVALLSNTPFTSKDVAYKNQSEWVLLICDNEISCRHKDQIISFSKDDFLIDNTFYNATQL